MCNAGALNTTFYIATQDFAMAIHLSQFTFGIFAIHPADHDTFYLLAFARLH